MMTNGVEKERSIKVQIPRRVKGSDTALLGKEDEAKMCSAVCSKWWRGGAKNCFA